MGCDSRALLQGLCARKRMNPKDRLHTERVGGAETSLSWVVTMAREASHCSISNLQVPNFLAPALTAQTTKGE